MKQKCSIPRSRLIVALALMAGGASVAADRDPDGWVIAATVHGWTRAGAALEPYDPVLVNELKTVCLTAISHDGDVEITESEEILVH